ncbi:phage tail protein [Stutzerimonas stutzeri]|uniref:Phage tail protein n=1 Tax=Stutzerimonas stutzeri TaxID=316 RepID=A0AA40RND5_STUST|nr:phage tail protein [Stutzerimonas stutzeri]MBA1302900.1 phage tail protein [Stutzerimonas stutzeri]
MPRITLAGEDLIAQKQVAQQPLNITRFIFANVPGLNPNNEVDRAAPKPPAGQIVYSAEIPAENKGYVNPAQVVYSLQVGSDVGDWDFNWIGLESAEGVLFAVAHVPLQQKRRNIPPLQIGNNITRNFLVVFDGAQALTGVTIDASTWQHDFTVRLAGIDERERQSNRDIFGRACFFGSALQLEKVGEIYQLKPGTAYVEGIRVDLAAGLPVAPDALPGTAWLDVALERELNDVLASWAVVWGADLTDYADTNGVQHHLIQIADLPDSNTVTDLRPMEPITGALVKHFQPKDETLTALAALDIAADQFIYATGKDNFAAAPITAFARSILNDPNAEAARETIGLGPSSAPSFSALELNAATPVIDFHFNGSQTDYTSRIVADGGNQLTVASAAKMQARFTDAGMTVGGNISPEGNVYVAGGGIRLGAVADGGSAGGAIDLRWDGTMRLTVSGDTGWGAWGTLWNSNNFDPSSKVSSDGMLVAGFVGGTSDSPYFRRSSDGAVFVLQRDLGFTPVRQGGGAGQSANIIHIGWSSEGRLKGQVDGTDLGRFIFSGDLSGELAALPISSIGTYAFARPINGATYNQGDLISGSQLLYSSTENTNGTVNNSGLIGGGTWRCHGASTSTNRTLWMRIA